MKIRVIFIMCLVLQSVPSYGTTILNVTGPNDFTQVLLEDYAAAAPFELFTSINNLSISAETQCFSCAAVAYLTTGLDVGFQYGDLLAVSPVGSGPLFSGIDLSAGEYFLVIGNTDGVLFWNASVNPVVTGNGDASRFIVDFYSDEAEAIAPESRFTPIIGGALHYDLTIVPEPVSSILFIIGSGALAGRLFLKKRKTIQ